MTWQVIYVNATEQIGHNTRPEWKATKEGLDIAEVLIKPSKRRPEGVRAAEHNSRPCPCGVGRLAQWPWALQTAALGFCNCEQARRELTFWRTSGWIPSMAPAA